MFAYLVRDYRLNALRTGVIRAATDEVAKWTLARRFAVRITDVFVYPADFDVDGIIIVHTTDL